MNPKINDVAKILSDESCSQMLLLLMDGKFHTVTELARAANIKNHTATYHIKKFIDLDWLEKEVQGRFHYYKLSAAHIAEIVEQLMPISKLPPVKSLKMDMEKQILFAGRTCYDHLAGKLGVGITKWFMEKGFIAASGKDAILTDTGAVFLSDCGINVTLLKKQKRCFCKMCIDWSEREYHLAGSVGQAINAYFLQNAWIEPHGKSRGVKLTDLGRENLVNNWHAPQILAEIS